jgi:hypothetical protein
MVTWKQILVIAAFIALATIVVSVLGSIRFI